MSACLLLGCAARRGRKKVWRSAVECLRKRGQNGRQVHVKLFSYAILGVIGREVHAAAFCLSPTFSFSFFLFPPFMVRDALHGGLYWGIEECKAYT